MGVYAMLVIKRLLAVALSNVKFVRLDMYPKIKGQSVLLVPVATMLMRHILHAV